MVEIFCDFAYLKNLNDSDTIIMITIMIAMIIMIAHAEHIAAGSKNDGSNFLPYIIQMFFVEIKIITQINEIFTRFSKNSHRANREIN